MTRIEAQDLPEDGAEPTDGRRSRRAFEPEDLFRFRFVTAADLAPDASRVVFALTRTDTRADAEYTDLVLLETDTGRQYRLTQADAINTQPVFSPSGSEVAFLSTRTGTPQLFLLPLAGGEPRQLTDMQFGVGGGPVWSPDGARIAFSAVPPGEPRDPFLPYRVDRAVWRADGIGLVEDALQDIYVVDATGGEPVRLTADRTLDTAPRWTPDGAGLVYTASFDPDTVGMSNRLRRTDLDGQVTEVASGGVIASHAVCPDGRIVYVLTHQDGVPSGSRADLWVYDPATGSRQRRTSELTGADVGGRVQPDMPAFGFSLSSVLASADSQFAYTPAQSGGEVNLLRIGLSGAEAHEIVAAGPRVCAPVQTRGESVLFAAYGITAPGDLYLHDTATNTQRQLTDLNASLRDELAWPVAHHLEFASTDGAGVEGWYLEPPAGTRPHPTVLGIHGGPHAGWGYTFCFDFLMLAGAGYGVLFLNQRGSTGYGDAFATAINADWGNLDYADLMAGVDHVIDHGVADPDRLGVFGTSGGGTLTGWIIGHTDRFQAACPEGPLFNFASIYGTSDIGIWACQAFLGGAPHERPETYRRCSPVTYAHRVTTPTLFLQHENDHRSPPEQTEQFYAILKTRGVTAEMLRFPSTGHAGSVLGPITHRRAQNEALLDWMNRHLHR